MTNSIERSARKRPEQKTSENLYYSILIYQQKKSSINRTTDNYLLNRFCSTGLLLKLTDSSDHRHGDH